METIRVKRTTHRRKNHFLRNAACLAAGAVICLYAGYHIGYSAGMEQPREMKLQRIYVVKENETVWDIAKKITTDHDDIRQVMNKIYTDNGFDGNHVLKAGDYVKLSF